MNFENNTLLLSTKLKIPSPRKNYIIRRGLFSQLDAAPDMSVTFIQGGAGTGKTTLVSSYIREKKLETVGWLSLDTEMTNLYSFWLYFTTALCPFLKDNERFIDYIKNSPDIRNIEQLIIMLINQIKTDTDYYMVLDDVHSIGGGDFIESFETFLQYMPENLHFFMLSREEPPIYLGPLAMSGKLLYIDNSLMYLSEQESLDFLKHTLQVKEDTAKLLKLSQYAEGWIGGLQLVVAAKSMENYSNTLFRAGGGIATAYLNRELFFHLEDSEKQFLIQTSAFPYFNYGICSSLFPHLSYEEFHQMMELMISKNLFIVVVDEEQEIYRYHNIFSEYLKQLFNKLPSHICSKLRAKVAAYLETEGNYMDALQIYQENNDYENIIRIIKNDASSFEVILYLKKIPLDILSESMELFVLTFLYEMWSFNDLERIKEMYTKCKEKYEDTEIFQIFRYVELYITHEKPFLPRLNPISLELIEKLDLQKIWKAFILIGNASALLNSMRYKEAEHCIQLSLSMMDDRNTYVVFFAMNQLAQLYEEVGRLNDSLDWYMKNQVQLLPSPDKLTLESNYYFGILGVYMRRMDLEKAESTLAYCEELTCKSILFYKLSKMTLEYHQAEMHFLRGNDAKGKEAVENLLVNYGNYSILTLLRLIYELLCVNLLEDELVQRTLTEIEFDSEFSHDLFTKILHARLLFHTGAIKAAEKINSDVLTLSRKSNNYLRLVESGILKIYMLVNTALGDPSNRELQNLILEAIHYACENKIIMPFYLDRKTLLPLLEFILAEAQKKQKLMTKEELVFTQNTIQLCKAKKTKFTEKGLLTNREREILQELALGITNKEISEKLCISQATVKTHVLSIYGKLGVSSRLKAVELARKEGFL